MREARDVRALAELDAGLVDGHSDDAAAAALRTRAAGDPEAAAVLDALAATRAELAELPPAPLPPEVAQRWTAALDAAASREAGHPLTGADPALDTAPRAVVPLATEPRASLPTVRRPGPGRRRPAARRNAAGRGGAGRATRPRLRRALVAAAVVVGAAVAGLAGSGRGLPAVSGAQLAAVGRGAFGVGDAGLLADPRRRAACLRHVLPGSTGSAPLLGARRVVLDGAEGVLLLLGTGRLGELDLVVVDPSCGPDGGTLLARTPIP